VPYINSHADILVCRSGESIILTLQPYDLHRDGDDCEIPGIPRCTASWRAGIGGVMRTRMGMENNSRRKFDGDV